MNSPIKAELSVPPLLGRAGVFQQRKVFQLFAQIRTAAGVFQTPDRNLIPEGWMADYLPQSPGECGDGLAPRAHKCERLWRLGTAAQVAYRSGAGPFSPLTPGQLDAFDSGAAVPAGAVTGGYGYFRVRYTVSTLIGRHTFFLDVGEMVELYAMQVNATLEGPPGTILVTERNDAESATPAQLTGLVVDARIGAMFMPIEAPTGLRQALYTQIVEVPQNTQVVIPVPKFARSVRIFQDNVGAATAAWERVVGPAAFFVVGSVTFTGRTSREIDSPIGRESALRTDLNALNDRLFQVVWTIRP